MKYFSYFFIAMLFTVFACSKQNETKMNKDAFWQIIEKTKNLDTKTMYLNLVKELKKLPIEDVQKFNAYTNGYVELVNGTIWVDMACKVINGYVSDDTGLYFTLWLISCGENVLLQALSEPDTLSALSEIPFGNADFEMLMSIGIDKDEIEYEKMEKIIEKVIGEISPTIKFKNGKQYGEYKSFEDAMADIPNILPKLVKRAESEKFDWKTYIK